MVVGESRIHPRRKTALLQFIARCHSAGIKLEDTSSGSNEIRLLMSLSELARNLGFSDQSSLATNIRENYIIKYSRHSIGINIGKFIEVLGEDVIKGILDGSTVVQLKDKSEGNSDKLSSKVSSKLLDRAFTMDTITTNLEDAICALKFIERSGVGDIFLRQPTVGVLFTKIYKITKECIMAGQPQYSAIKIKSLVSSAQVMTTKESLELAKAALTLAKAAQTDKNIQIVLERNPDVFIFVTEIIFGMGNS